MTEDTFTSAWAEATLTKPGEFTIKLDVTDSAPDALTATSEFTVTVTDGDPGGSGGLSGGCDVTALGLTAHGASRGLAAAALPLPVLLVLLWRRGRRAARKRQRPPSAPRC